MPIASAGATHRPLCSLCPLPSQHFAEWFESVPSIFAPSPGSQEKVVSRRGCRVMSTHLETSLRHRAVAPWRLLPALCYPLLQPALSPPVVLPSAARPLQYGPSPSSPPLLFSQPRSVPAPFRRLSPRSRSMFAKWISSIPQPAPPQLPPACCNQL